MAESELEAIVQSLPSTWEGRSILASPIHRSDFSNHPDWKLFEWLCDI
jgi:hypothetical protein